MTRRIRRTRGQTAVEFALGVVVLVMLVLGVLQGGVVYYDHVTLEAAARDGAHLASIQRTASGLTQAQALASARQAALDDAQGLDASKLTVTVASADPPAPGVQDSVFWEAGDTLTVTVTYPYSFDIIGFPVTSGTLSSSSSMRIE